MEITDNGLVEVELPFAESSTDPFIADYVRCEVETLIGSVLHRYAHHQLIDPKALDLKGVLKAS